MKKKDKRVVAVHKNGLGDYVVSMKIRSQIDLSGIADLVKEMFEQSELYDIVKYYKPHFTVQRIDSSEEISQGYCDEEPEQEDIDYDTGVIGDKVLDRPLTEEPEEILSKPGRIFPSDRGYGDIRSNKVMELYDKKYVYFEWDDKLEGKKVILAHTIKNIKEFVSSGDEGRFFIAQKGNGLPFTNGICECEFAYYDPNYEVKKAYNEGKKLQWKYRNEEDWKDWDNDSCPTFFVDTNGYELRVKPDDCETDNDYLKDRFITNKELAMWLAQGKGQVQDRRTGRISTDYYYFEYDDSQVDYMNIGIRKWGDDKWHEPTYNYYFGVK